MEAKPSPHLKKVLKSYQLSAANTMSGPSTVMSRLENVNGVPISRNRNGSLDGGIINSESVREFLQFSKQNHKIGVFNRSTSLSIGSSNNSNSVPYKQIGLVPGGIKQEKICNPQRATTNTNGGYEVRDNAGVLIIKSTAQQQQRQQQLPPPILSTPDRSKPEKRETILEGELIACFSVGGEKRLCFPQVMNCVLKGIGLPEINQVCDELQIFCSRCSGEQLDVLKRTKVIPASAHSCGLITKTDAERLVNSLLHRNPPKSAMSVLSAVNRPQDPNRPHPNSHFRISHHCFGKGQGVVLPHLYEKPDSLCIECVDCHGLFSPQRFVCHSHHRQENRTCHWGFDSMKWRNYVTVTKDQENREKLEKALEDFKARFDRKRKESSESLEEICNGVGGGGNSEDRIVIKRIRFSDSSLTNSPPSPSPYLSSPTSLSILPTKKRLSFLQHTDNESTAIQHSPPQLQIIGVDQYELDAVRNLVAGSMARDGADFVIGYLESLARKVSSLEQICRSQDTLLRGIQEKGSPPLSELKSHHVVESEIHSVKKHFLKRSGEEVA